MTQYGQNNLNKNQSSPNVAVCHLIQMGRKIEISQTSFMVILINNPDELLNQRSLLNPSFQV